MIRRQTSDIRRQTCRFPLPVLVALALPLAAQDIAPLPDSSGWGVHVLALARGPDSAIWVGTYGQGIFVLRQGAGSWDQYRAVDYMAARSISWDFVHAFGFGSRGEVWYGTVGNGWGVSSDGGKTWKNRGFAELGAEWQYVAPNGIVTRGDTVYIATADGIRLTWDNGVTWAEVTDSAGAAKAKNLWGRIASEYVLAIATGSDGAIWAAHLRGVSRSTDGGSSWREFGAVDDSRARALLPDDLGTVWVGTERGTYRYDPLHRLRDQPREGCARGSRPGICDVGIGPHVSQLVSDSGEGFLAASGEGLIALTRRIELRGSPARSAQATSVLRVGQSRYLVGWLDGLGEIHARPEFRGYRETFVTEAVPSGSPPSSPRHTCFRRPIALADQPYIDQTYRYGSTMRGSFQQHQGVEFNNPDGTPVHAIGDGTVVFAGPAEAGALTVAIKHAKQLTANGQRLFVFSVYYHNSKLLVAAGRRVRTGDVISLVGNTGRATNDHLHLEVHASPVDSVGLIVDASQRYPRYTTNPELWIAPLPGTGAVAGQVWDARHGAVQQARIYGLVKGEPQETPFSFIETYGARAHPSPAYGEHFAVSDVPPGEYLLGAVIDGKRVYRSVRIEAGKVTWVEFRPDAH